MCGSDTSHTYTHAYPSCYLSYHAFAGVPVCASAWFIYHGMHRNDSRVKRVLALVRKGANVYLPTGKSGRKPGRDNSRGVAARAWLVDYVKDYSQHMPHKCLLRCEPVDVKELRQFYVAQSTLLDQVCEMICTYISIASTEMSMHAGPIKALTILFCLE